MKKFIRITAVVMAMLLCCAIFAACGDSDSKDSSGEKSSAASSENTTAGKTETWGNITVLVPDGMTLKGGNALDENDPDVVNIAKDDNAMNYILITINDDEEGVKAGIESTKEINEGCVEITFDAGASWQGVSYDYSGTDVNQVYGLVDGRYAVVQSYGFDWADDDYRAVLSSLKVAAAAE